MHVRLCGINSTHSKGIKIEQATGFGDYLFLRLKTPARFYVDGEFCEAAADDIILYRKGAPQFYESPEDTVYIDDFMFFDTDDEAEQDFLDRLALTFDRPLRLPCIHPFMNIHQLICMESIHSSELRTESVTCLLKYFLIKLSESMHADVSHRDYTLLARLNELRLALYSSPAQKWTVTDMANYVNLSPSYFQTVYKKIFHIPCMTDLFNSRMNHAKELLSTTQIPVNEIAESCGYESGIYFARHFKRKVGMTPTEYRKRHS